MAQNNGPRVDFGKVTTTRVQDGISASADIAVLRQDVVTTYPAASAGNNKVASLFGGSDFGDGQTYNSSRNTIYKIPKGMTAEQVAAHLENVAPSAHIYRELSFDIKDVLTDDQLSMLDQGLSSKTIEEYKEDKAVKNSETQAKVLVDGKVQYRSLHLAMEFKADVDYRDTVAAPAERVQIADETVVVETGEIVVPAEAPKM